MTPRTAQIGRDEILFEAGRQDAFRWQRRTLYKWYAACAVLSCVVCGQWFLLSGRSSSDSTPVASQPPSAPEPATLPEPALAQDFPDGLASVPPSGEAATDHFRARTPNVWTQLIPLPTMAPATMALGGDLSIGSAARGTFCETCLIPKPGRMLLQDEPPLSATDRLRLPE